MFQKLKSYMMPLAMAIGIIFYGFFQEFSFLTPYLIAIMLFLSYSNISLHDIRISHLHFWLLFIQIVGCLAVFIVAYPLGISVAQAAMICVLAPTATSAVVITGMLGGNTASLTAYSLLSNFSVAVFAPLAFTVLGDNHEISFGHTLFNITQRVFILLLSPFILALLLRKFTPKIHDIVRRGQSLSFYLWSLALIIVTARTVAFITQQGSSSLWTEITIAAVALVICIAQFITGRRLGKIYNDTIAGGQGLGQKNTILAIWMAQNYMTPISSIGPGAYVLWQNIINSYQVWRKRKNL